jgi:hypothetical protein
MSSSVRIKFGHIYKLEKQIKVTEKKITFYNLYGHMSSTCHAFAIQERNTEEPDRATTRVL